MNSRGGYYIVVRCSLSLVAIIATHMVSPPRWWASSKKTVVQTSLSYFFQYASYSFTRSPSLKNCAGERVSYQDTGRTLEVVFVYLCFDVVGRFILRLPSGRKGNEIEATWAAGYLSGQQRVVGLLQQDYERVQLLGILIRVCHVPGALRREYFEAVLNWQNVSGVG